MVAKCADAAADLAVREANYQMLLEEERQEESIWELEEQQQKALEAQKWKLEWLQAKREVRAAQAELKGADYINTEKKTRKPKMCPKS